jgi:hypothetical protein
MAETHRAVSSALIPFSPKIISYSQNFDLNKEGVIIKCP